METTIREGLQELKLATQKLELIRPLLSNRDNNVRNTAKETLTNALLTLSHLSNEYHVTLWKIEILRLLNRYEAIRNLMLRGSTQDFSQIKESINYLET